MTCPLIAADDAKLMALEQHWLAMQPEIGTLDDRYSEALHAAIDRMDQRSIDASFSLFTGYMREVGYSEEDEVRSRTLQDEEGWTERRIMYLPASGAAGLAVKLRMLARYMRQDERDPIIDMAEEDLEWSNLYAIRALRDAERLAGQVRT